jgi:ketosteroid isomerase-like protein
MALLSKTTVATAVFAVISSQALSEACRDLKPDMAYMFRGPGHMMTATLDEQHRSAMMKHAQKLPKNTVFFMKDGELYTASGMPENSLDELHFE